MFARTSSCGSIWGKKSYGATVKKTRPWRLFYSSLPAQTLFALSFNIISLFAGGLISLLTPRFQEAPWIIALFPPILTIRGDISGILSGNLTTMLHLGLVRPQIRENTDTYRSLISAILVLTVIDTLAMGTLSFALSFLFRGGPLWRFFIYTCVPTVSCTLAMVLSIPITSLIAVTSYRKGLNPDILVYPVLASINDIVVTTSFTAVATLIIMGGPAHYLLGATFFFIIILCILLVWRNRRSNFFYRTIREGTLVVTFSSLFGSINGFFLSGLIQNLIKNPGLVVLYPALANMLGNIGSISGSITTTNLALGYISSFKEEVRRGLLRILKVEVVAALMHVLLGIIAYQIVRTIFAGARLSFLVGVALISNFSSFLLISFLAFIFAFLSFRRGLNPDNVVIPAITSISDFVATMSISPAITILKFISN